MDPLSFGYVAGGVSGLGGLASNLAFGISDRRNQKKQQARDNFWRSWYAGLDLQQFENTKDMQQWQKDAWSKEFEYNKELNDRNFDLATNAANYRAQDLVNAGMSPLLAAGGAAQTPQTVSAPAASSMPTGSGRGGSSPSAPSVGAYNADSFMKFADFMANLKLIEAQTRKLNSEAQATEDINNPDTPRGRQFILLLNEIESRTLLNEHQVTRILSDVSRINMDTYLKFLDSELKQQQKFTFSESFRSLKLSNDKQQLIIDYARDNGISPDAVSSDFHKSVVLGKMLSTLYYGDYKSLSPDQLGLLISLIPDARSTGLSMTLVETVLAGRSLFGGPQKVSEPPKLSVDRSSSFFDTYYGLPD